MESILSLCVCLLAWLCTVEGGALPSKRFEMPATCTGQDYCTKKADQYPQALVDRLLERANITFTDGKPTVGQRSGDEERDCEALRRDDLVYEIVDAAGLVRVVAQSSIGFRQQLTIETCLQPGHIDHPTMHFPQDMVNEFNLTCVERTLPYRFLVLTADWAGLEQVEPKDGIPVRCDCVFAGRAQDDTQ